MTEPTNPTDPYGEPIARPVNASGEQAPPERAAPPPGQSDTDAGMPVPEEPPATERQSQPSDAGDEPARPGQPWDGPGSAGASGPSSGGSAPLGAPGQGAADSHASHPVDDAGPDGGGPGDPAGLPSESRGDLAEPPSADLDAPTTTMPAVAAEPPISGFGAPEPLAAADGAFLPLTTPPPALPLVGDPAPSGLGSTHAVRDDELDDGEPLTVTRGGLARTLAIIGLVVLLLAALVGLALALRTIQRDRQQETSRKAAVATARTFARDVTTYDYTTISKDFARVLAESTGTFHDQYSKATDNSGQFIKLVQQYKGRATGEVVAVGVESATATRATVVAIVTQTVQNTNRPTPQVQRQEGRIMLVKTHGRWLVSDFAVL